MGSWQSTTRKATGATGGTRKRSCPSVEEKESKRAKIDESSLVLPHLPPELWANTLEYLEYSDVMQCTAASPAFLREVLPRVQTLFINRRKQLDLRQTQRFKTGCVKSVYIIMCYGFYYHSHTDRSLRLVTQSLVPFLQQFSQLEYVFLGEILRDSDDATTTVRKHSPTGVCVRNALRASRLYGGTNLTSDYQHFVGAAFAAFRFGLLPKNLTIDGGFSTDLSPCGYIQGLGRRCAACRAFCDQRIEILLHREGGAEFLRNSKRLLPVFRNVLRIRSSSSTRHGFQGISRLVELGCNP